MIRSSQRFAPKLLRWYDRNRRQLPWRPARGAPPDPYHVLLSETMLQQTQVATVVPYFARFLKQFPTIHDLAIADEQKVLRLWQGLGYYSRARNLHRTARQIVDQHQGELPANLAELRALPGVGRYTAGAVASIAFGIRAPILDGNVARVLCRLDRIGSDPRKSAARNKLWRRADEVLPRTRVGDFNSALMELGATVCTPRNPKCAICPVRGFCEASAAGVQSDIPTPRRRPKSPVERRWTFCVRRRNRWLIEQRPSTGRWAGMWQFVTVAADGRSPPCAGSLERLATISHDLTHRHYEFDVYVCDATCANRLPRASRTVRRWIKLTELGEIPLPGPHVKIARMLSERREDGSKKRSKSG